MTEGYAQVKAYNLDPDKAYYVYVHRRLSDNKPFYVGKGNKYRAWVTKGRSEFWNRVVNKHGFKVEIVFDNLTEEESFQCEVDTILELKYFGYPLTNLTSGGEGGSNPSDITRQRMSLAKLGKFIGNSNPFADSTVYKFVRLTDGFIFNGTRSDLCQEYKIPNGQLKKLFLTKPRKSVYGWSLYKE